MHRDEGGVGAEKGDPEVELAQALIHEPTEDSREPEVDAGERGEASGHGHDQVEVGDNEVGVVQVAIQAWLREDRAGESAGYEERDEADGEQHGGSELNAAAP